MTAIPYTFTNGTDADADQVNANFVYVGMVPVGAILPWAKSITGVPALPSGFVECSGQTLSDAESLLNGQVIPNLNGDARALIGAATSGTTGDITHSHNVSQSNHTHSATAGGGSTGGASANVSINNSTALLATYTIVWIMRIK